MLGARRLCLDALVRTRLGSARCNCWRRNVCPACAQVWSAKAGWQKVVGCSVTPMLTADTDISKRDSHAWLFGWKNATIFQVRRS